MPNYTPNYNLAKPLGSEAYDIAVPNGNMDTLDTTLKRIDNNAPQYVVATGTNTLVVTLDPAPASLYAGLSFRFYNPSNSTALVTINANNQGAKALRKNGGTQVGANGLKQGIYTVSYDGTSFILQGEDGGGGNAIASDLLSGKTAVSDAGELVGTMPNRGAFNLGLGVTVPAGYYSGGTTPNGSRRASGTISSSSTTNTFSFADNSRQVLIPFVQVSGINFLPNNIILFSNSSSRCSLYNRNLNSTYPNTIKMFGFNGNEFATGTTNVKNDQNAAYVNSTGFRLPVPSTSENYTWIAYE